MRISEVARRAGVPATTLRYYEDVGLLEAPRGSNGYRCYDEGVLERLSFIEGAKHLGLSLPEIVELLVVVEGDTCTQVRETLHPQLVRHLREVDRRLEEFRRLRVRLAAATEQVAACPDSGESCRSECMLLGNGSSRCGPASELPSAPNGHIEGKACP